MLHFARKHRDHQRLKAAGCPVSFVYLAWESATLPILRLQRRPDLPTDLSTRLTEFFDEQDRFTGRLPEDFYRLEQLVYGRDDFQLGDDAKRYVQQYAEDAATALRGQEISRQIKQSNGILPGLKVKLFPYQVDGVAFLAARGRALLADDMGLGKTLQAFKPPSERA
ncbi:hypothetical protein [Methylomonas rhizoryzae]|uniref:hypothetical protein n=1 Tax=Methylomonas rhizoryzae TaxID=2608981 RepID=UPI001232A3CF|nr:hypothetical protein [Methylomonas rhizoryzae]